MDLTSCDNCGVVYDRDNMCFPNTFTYEGISTEHAIWDGDKYVSTIKCPVCNDGYIREKG